MSILKKALIKASGNSLIQNILEKNVQVSQYLLGIGSGGDVISSGEQSIFDVLKQRHESPQCIFDVGSNKGQFLRLVLDNITTDNFQIHSFEPGCRTFKILSESFKGDKRIKLNNIGIGKDNGAGILHYDSAGSGIASLTKRRLNHFGIDFNKSEKVEITTIDNYCSENAISHIQLL